jgi:hypothetical protein
MEMAQEGQRAVAPLELRPMRKAGSYVTSSTIFGLDTSYSLLYPMKAAVTLRLHTSHTDFRVLFPYSDAALRTALLAAGAYYDDTAQSYLVPAALEVIDRLRVTCQARGLALHVPPTPTLVMESPAPTPHEELLSRYCQHIILRRLSPQTLRSYRQAFQAFLAYHSPISRIRMYSTTWLPALVRAYPNRTSK